MYQTHLLITADSKQTATKHVLAPLLFCTEKPTLAPTDKLSCLAHDWMGIYYFQLWMETITECCLPDER